MLAAQGQQLELAAGVLEEAALAFEDVHRPGHRAEPPGHRTRRCGSRWPRWLLSSWRSAAAAAVQGDMRRDGHADGLAHLGVGEA